MKRLLVAVKPLSLIRVLALTFLLVVACGGGSSGSLSSLSQVPQDGTWRGLVIAAENRCSPYDLDDYPYSQSVEDLIIAELGGIYSPYTGETFTSKTETDIEHMVATSEAHDSGLCAADAATKRRFASDLLNLTLADPTTNRHEKSDKDAADWLPDMNRCWFADRVVRVRREYDLTIDRREASALEAVLSGCGSTSLVTSPPGQTPTPSVNDALALYDNDGNGRITCAEAEGHGIAPVHRGHPAYPFMNDRDNDGVVCEVTSPPGQTPTPSVNDALALYDDNGNGRITCAEAREHGIAPVHRGHPAYPFMNDRDNDGVVCE